MTEHGTIRSCLCAHGNDAPGMTKEIIRSAMKTDPDYAAAERQLREKMPAEEADRFMRSAPRIEVLKAAAAALPETTETAIRKLRDTAGLAQRKRINAPAIFEAPYISEDKQTAIQKLRNAAGLSRQRIIHHTSRV